MGFFSKKKVKEEEPVASPDPPALPLPDVPAATTDESFVSNDGDVEFDDVHVREILRKFYSMYEPSKVDSLDKIVMFARKSGLVKLDEGLLKKYECCTGLAGIPGVNVFVPEEAPPTVVPPVIDTEGFNIRMPTKPTPLYLDTPPAAQEVGHIMYKNLDSCLMSKRLEFIHEDLLQLGIIEYLDLAKLDSFGCSESVWGKLNFTDKKKLKNLVNDVKEISSPGIGETIHEGIREASNSPSLASAALAVAAAQKMMTKAGIPRNDQAKSVRDFDDVPDLIGPGDEPPPLPPKRSVSPMPSIPPPVPPPVPPQAVSPQPVPPPPPLLVPPPVPPQSTQEVATVVVTPGADGNTPVTGGPFLVESEEEDSEEEDGEEVESDVDLTNEESQISHKEQDVQTKEQIAALASLERQERNARQERDALSGVVEGSVDEATSPKSSPRFGVGVLGMVNMSDLKSRLHTRNSDEIVEQERAGQPCHAFKLDMNATAFNTCKCGFPKTSHVVTVPARPLSLRSTGKVPDGSKKEAGVSIVPPPHSPVIQAPPPIVQAPPPVPVVQAPTIVDIPVVRPPTVFSVVETPPEVVAVPISHSDHDVSVPPRPPSKGASVRSGDSSHDDLSVREIVEAFYRANNPEKLDTVDVIMERFKGREDILLAKLGKKYNTEV